MSVSDEDSKVADQYLSILAGIHWVIVGGESGPRARPVQAEWVKAIRDQCIAADVAFFFKQWGGLRPKSGGRKLDEKEWSQYPEVPMNLASAMG